MKILGIGLDLGSTTAKFAVVDSEGKILAENQPHDQGYQGDTDHDRNKNGSDLIRKARDRSLG